MVNHKQLIDDIHRLLETSEGYASYSAKVARLYRRRDTVTKWLVAVAACGPFIDKLTSTSEPIASWLLAIIPLLAIALPLLNYSKKIELAGSMHSNYVSVLPELRELWRLVCSRGKPSDRSLNSWNRTLSSVENKLAEIRTKKSEMPEIKKLAKEADKQAEKYKKPNFYDELESDEDEDGDDDRGSVVNYEMIQ